MVSDGDFRRTLAYQTIFPKGRNSRETCSPHLAITYALVLKCWRLTQTIPTALKSQLKETARYNKLLSVMLCGAGRVDPAIALVRIVDLVVTIVVYATNCTVVAI